MDKKIKDLKKEQDIENEPKTKASFEEKENNAFLQTTSTKIKTADDAIKYAQVDMSVWEILNQKVNFWDVTGSFGTPGAKTYTNYQIKITFRRIVNSPIKLGIEELLKTYKPPVYKPIVYDNINQKEEHMLEISLFDHHFGMLAWRNETNEDYDLKIAGELYEKGVRCLLDKAQGVNVEKILFPIGSDFFHINNQEAVTPRGKNRLDTDARLGKVYYAGLVACIKAIETCLKVAPVEIVWIPGNHDPQMSYFMCITLDHHFMFANKAVTVDVSEKCRKYVKYGISLLGLTHGCEEPIKNLPLIMADEEKQAWADTIQHEIHIGHVHKRKEMIFVSTDSFGSVSVRTLPSLSKTDFWHYQKGYVGGQKACEGYLWGKKSGYAGHFSGNSYLLK